MLERLQIGDCVDSCSSWNPVAEAPDGEFVYIDIASVDRNGKCIADASKIRGREAPSRARQLVRENDILVSTVRPNLNAVAIVTSQFDGATASTGFAVLRPRANRIDARYLFHWVKSPQFVDQMVRQATGASYPAVSDRIVRSAELPVHKISEQRRIAAILDKADALRAKRREAIAKLDQLLQSVFLDMFGDPVTNPRGWDCRRLDSVCSLINGRAFKPEEWEEEGLPIVRIQNLNDASKPFNYTTKTLPERFRVLPGDVLFSWSGTPGTSFGCFRWSGPEGWLNQHIFNVKLNGVLDSEFFIAQLNLKLSELVAKAHGGVGLQHVTKKMVDETELMIVPDQLQVEFAKRVGAVRGLIRDTKRSLEVLNLQFGSLQQRAFSGAL